MMHHVEGFDIGVERQWFVTAFVVIYDQLVVLLEGFRLVW